MCTPVPRSDGLSIMHPQFSLKIKGEIQFLHQKSALHPSTPGRRSDVSSIMQVQTYLGGGVYTTMPLTQADAENLARFEEV